VGIVSLVSVWVGCCFFFQAEDGIRDRNVTGVQTCALPISTVIGTASCIWVRPIFSTCEYSAPFARRVVIRWSIDSTRAGKVSRIPSRSAVGYTSLVDWARVTWLLGWRRSYSPLLRPRISSARLGVTSLAFVFVLVPARAW